MTNVTTYLDYNATNPVKPEIAEAMAAALLQVGNPSSVHRHGRLARRLLDDAREDVALLLGAAPREIVFTSGGTEANNLALSLAMSGGPVTRLLVSSIEHASVLDVARSHPVECVLIPCTKEGIVDLDALRSLLSEPSPNGGRTLVCVMLVNNETGIVQPVREACEMAHEAGALFHCDAVQAVGKMEFSWSDLDVDMMSVSAHKFGGPTGVGALVVKDALTLTPSIRGGGQEEGRRGGTQNVPGIVGFGRAAALARRDMMVLREIGLWRDGLEEEVAEIAPDAVFFGRDAPRIPTTTCFALPGLSAETQVIALDLAGVSVSAGAACSSGKVTASHVLTAMGASAEEAASAIRISFGWASGEQDVDRFLAAWRGAYVTQRGAFGSGAGSRRVHRGITAGLIE